jgi:hypothetical protein
MKTFTSLSKPPEEVPEWEFGPGRFRYRGGKWDDRLTGQSFRLLQEFYEATDKTLSHNQINRICSRDPNGYTSRANAYVSELNRKLRTLLKLRDSPIVPIPGQQIYRLQSPM